MEPTIYRVSKEWMSAQIVFWLAAGIFAALTSIVPLIGCIMIVRAIGSALTTSVLFDERGITLRNRLITTNEQRLPLEHINAVTTSTNPLGTMFDYGTIALTVGNDRNQIKVSNLTGCADLKARIDAFGGRRVAPR